MFKIIGITGGIAAGKSAFTDILEAVGETVIDVDKINRAVLQLREVINNVAVAFPSVCTGTFVVRDRIRCDIIDRAALSKIVFGNPEEMKKLKAIIDPEIQMRTDIALLKAAQAGKKFVFYCHPLLITSGQYARCNEIVEITCYRKTQIERLMERSKLTEEEAIARIELQKQGFHSGWPADLIPPLTKIENNGALSELHPKIMKYVIDLYRKY